ncbi:hypothetical protein HS088_TW10G00463 [Tripterygium wilfordii]|uniref:Uncharacterized protein n=1 Tax=Tripterygium wilfordii TaxID=458696 RepID=A0A7J7D5Y1_TRIWF|nr:hypothetical protein HS088_TW10G00463 [Tripterygium wilfordii]
MAIILHPNDNGETHGKSAKQSLDINALQTPETCIPPNSPPKPHLRFPKSSCDSSPRHHLPLHKNNLRLWSSKSLQTLIVKDSRDPEVREIAGLFKNSKVLGVENITLIGSKMTMIILRIVKAT